MSIFIGRLPLLVVFIVFLGGWGVWLSRCGTNGDIQLSGQFIMEDHCSFKNEGGECDKESGGYTFLSRTANYKSLLEWPKSA